ITLHHTRFVPQTAAGVGLRRFAANPTYRAVCSSPFPPLGPLRLAPTGLRLYNPPQLCALPGSALSPQQTEHHHGL
ncbi:MAG: hypothetical protein WA987_08430, partial [Cellvibrio sp.]